MKKQRYTHITKSERLEIAILLDKGHSIRSIAGALGRSPGGISEEIRNNSVDGIYDPHKANHKAYVKRKYSKYEGMKIVGDDKLRDYVEKGINQDWSPEQLAGRLKEIDTDIKYASHVAVYRYIYSVYGRQLEQHLRRKGKKKKGRRPKSTVSKNRTFIDERPEIINSRERFGDWEGDLIVSGKYGKGVLLVLHSRKGRFPIIEKVMSRKTAIVNQHIYERTGGFICFNSLTIDSDISFQKHEEMSSMIGAPVYFCHPYSAWEKGGVENTNGLIRQYIPKGSDISKYSKKYIREIEFKLQNRPRKCLGYKTPMEVMLENDQIDTTFFLGNKRLGLGVIKNTQVFSLGA
jgi:IS30 family transposase